MGILKFIGRDSGFGKNNNSAYVECGKKLIIIDCGYTVFEKARNKFNFDKYEEIDVIITHLHNDHAGSLSQLILYLWFVYNKKITVFCKCKNIREYLDITGTPKEAYKLKTNSSNIEFIKTEHTKYLDAYGFCLYINNKKIIYTGDTSVIEPFLPYLLNETNEFYVDVSKNGGAHLKIDDVNVELEKIKDKGIDVFLMHLDDKEYIENVTNGEFNM